MKREAKQIVDRIADAIAAAAIFNNPMELREAAAYIRSPEFSADDADRDVVSAFADLLEKKAERKDHALRETYGR